MKTTILVTGSNGQLGNEIKKVSINYPNAQFLFTDVNELDITNKEACLSYFNAINPNYVINCAAYTAVDKAEQEMELASKINVEAVQNLVDACRVNNAKFIHVSTDYVFDGNNYKPYVEDDKTNPQSKYGLTKLNGELAALSYDKTIVLRTSWLYSTFGNNFVKTMLRLGNERNQLNVVFDQIGTPTYAEDLAQAILQIISDIEANKTNFSSGIYHYSNEGVCSWYDFALAILSKANSKCTVLPIESKDYPTPAKRPYYSVLNKSKIKSTFNITIPHWEASLNRCLLALNSI